MIGPMSPDTTGANGELDQPGEPIIWNGMLLISCFDMVTDDGKVNSAHGAPQTLAWISVETSSKPTEPTQPVDPIQPAQPTEPTQPSAATYKVKAGDCLWNIAARELGSGKRWNEIYELNKAIIKNPNRIYVGQVLTLPQK